MGAPVLHFEIMGKDAQKVQEFYGKLFGWKIDTNNPMHYGVVDTGSGTGIQGGVGADDGGGPRCTIYVQVPDLDACLKQVEIMGGKKLMGPEDVPGGPTIALFADPDGTVVGLLKE